MNFGLRIERFVVQIVNTKGKSKFLLCRLFYSQIPIFIVNILHILFTYYERYLSVIPPHLRYATMVNYYDGIYYDGITEKYPMNDIRQNEQSST